MYHLTTCFYLRSEKDSSQALYFSSVISSVHGHTQSSGRLPHDMSYECMEVILAVINLHPSFISVTLKENN